MGVPPGGGPETLPPGSRCLFDAKTVDRAVDRLAVELAVRLWDANPVVICLMKGGLPFAADLVRRFYFNLELDYFHLARYSQQQGGELRMLRTPDTPLAGRTVLLADDVLDVGHTLRCAQQWTVDAGAKETLTTVLVRKDVPGAVATADYVALEAPNEFLVGRGMDVDGAWRQLSGIHCLPAP